MQHIQLPCIWTAVADATVWSLLVHEITFMQSYIRVVISVVFVKYYLLHTSLSPQNH